MADNFAELYSGPLTEKEKAQLVEVSCDDGPHARATNQYIRQAETATARYQYYDYFRSMVSDLIKSNSKLDDDDELLRWIRAREWNLKKADKMLRDNQAWRKNYVDKLAGWEVPEVIRKYAAGNYFGHDKQGYPVWYELTGFMDPDGMAQSVSKVDLIKHRIYMLEHLANNIFPERSKEAGKRIDKCSVIFDMDGMGMRHLNISFASLVKELLILIEANYPETLWHAYILNAPSVFPVMYNMAKPFLAQYTRSKIHFLGSNWKEVLLEYFDADQLPVHYGGTATDPDGDPQCKAQIGIGGKIPESYYLKNMAAENFDMSQFTTVTITRGQSLQLDYQVSVPKAVLRWNFWTESKDLAFGVFRRTFAAIRQKVEDMEPVVANSRVSCDVIPESGCYECDEPGTYVVRFDNSYSWMTSKKLSYLIEVIMPGTLSDSSPSPQSSSANVTVF